MPSTVPATWRRSPACGHRAQGARLTGGVQVGPDLVVAGGWHPPGVGDPARAGSVATWERACHQAGVDAANGRPSASLSQLKGTRPAGPHGARPYAYALACMSLTMTAGAKSAFVVRVRGMPIADSALPPGWLDHLGKQRRVA
jgi:hypothetical protein